MEDKIEIAILKSLREDVTELERRVDALAETLKHVIAALDSGDFSQPPAKPKPDFSHIEGWIQHSPSPK